jgi:hypothetical protein
MLKPKSEQQKECQSSRPARRPRTRCRHTRVSGLCCRFAGRPARFERTNTSPISSIPAECLRKASAELTWTGDRASAFQARCSGYGRAAGSLGSHGDGCSVAALRLRLDEHQRECRQLLQHPFLHRRLEQPKRLRSRMQRRNMESLRWSVGGLFEAQRRALKRQRDGA